MRPRPSRAPFTRRRWLAGFRLDCCGWLAFLVAIVPAASAGPPAAGLPAVNQRKALILGRGEPLRDSNGGPTHPQAAKLNFLQLLGNPQNDPARGWTADLSYDLLLRLGMNPTNTPVETLFNYIGQHHLGYRIVIQNSAGGAAASFWGCAVDNGMMPFAPQGNNEPGLYIPDPIGIKASVAVGGGTAANAHSYGPSLEFFDAMPLWVWQNTFEDTAQSWANQVVAARFARVLDAHPNYNLWDAREFLRQSASYWAAGWTERNGYGRPNENAVVGKLMPAPPVEFVVTRSADGRQVRFTWRNFLQSDFAGTVIAGPGNRVLYRGTGTNFTWTSDVDGPATFTDWSENRAGEKSRLETYQTHVVTGLVSELNPTLTAIRSRDRRYVTLSWHNPRRPDFAAAVISGTDGRTLYEGTGTNFVWTSDLNGPATFAFAVRTKSGTTVREPFYQTCTVTDLVVRLNPTCLILSGPTERNDLNPQIKAAFQSAARDWAADLIYRPGNPVYDRAQSFPQGDVVAVLPDFPAMADYGIAHDYQILVVPAVYGADDSFYECKVDWDRATASNSLVVAGYNISVATRKGDEKTIPPRLYSAITVGWDTGHPVIRCAGPGLEFVDRFESASLRLVPVSKLPTFAAAHVAGLLARILEANRGYNIWDARQHLRQTASHYAAGWVPDGGYGRPAEEVAALASLDSAPPVDLQVVRADDGKSVTFTWENFRQSSFATTVIQRKDGRVIYEGTATRYVWPSDVGGDETFRFFSRDKSGNLSRAETYTKFPVTGLVRK